MHYITTKTILSPKNGINLYRGCTHGCIYCDSRSQCYRMDHPFEDVAVKQNALPLLEKALAGRRAPCMVGMGSMTDPYIPLEQELEYTRGALQLIYDYGFGVTLITKSDLVLRDIDLLKKINDRTKCVVQMTLTTFDEELCRKLEPNVCTTARRFEALCRLRQEGIPTVVWLCPILPFLNDTPENIAGILDYCIRAEVKGVVCFGMGLTLREGNREYFYRQLDSHFPGLKERYIRSYGDQYSLPSFRQQELMDLFHQTCARHHILHSNNRIFEYLNTFEQKEPPAQLSLF